MQRVAVAALLVALAIVAACGQSSADAEGRELRVFAASSLTEAFGVMSAAFERANPEVDVRITFGSSTALARQIADGAQADVFAPADEVALDAVRRELREPVIIARNRLTIVVELGNPLGIAGLGDLARAPVVVLCAPEVPCGRYAQEALAASGVSLQPTSLEENVKAVLARVALGEADAGIVYATDAAAARDQIDAVEIRGAANLEPAYPMAILADAENSERAAEWVDFVRSPEGREILENHGFGAP